MEEKTKNDATALVRPRVYLGPGIALGPGKIDLLRKVDECGSISAAGRALGIPYKRAWMLIDTLNTGFGRPLVATATGGRGGGGAVLTSLGRQVVAGYDALERRLNAEASCELAALRALLAPPEKE